MKPNFKSKKEFKHKKNDKNKITKDRGSKGPLKSGGSHFHRRKQQHTANDIGNVTGAGKGKTITKRRNFQKRSDGNQISFKKNNIKWRDNKKDKIFEQSNNNLTKHGYTNASGNLKSEKLIIATDTSWFEKVPAPPKEVVQLDPSLVTKLKREAEELWKKEAAIFEANANADRSTQANWLRTVMKSGTLSDKVAAFTMLVQDAPVHSMRSLEALMSMSHKKGRRESLMAIDSLRHLWVTVLLPDRKLKFFNQWPLNNLDILMTDESRVAKDRLLLLLFFEDMLKKKYMEYVDIVEKHLQDTLSDIRNKALGIVHELLTLKPEEEQKLLKAMVNKVGDPERKVASRASFLLTELVGRHPNMKLVVTEEVERLLFRPNISVKAQYYAICFLNQLILTSKEKELASKLIGIYFSFFKVYANKPETESKILSALLTGVNRAFPFAKDEDEKYEEQMNMLFKVSHISKFGTSVQALMLLYQVMDVRQSVSDRYYQAVYDKISNAEPKSAAKQAMFLNLLFKSMKNDTSVNRIKGFFKRLLQTCANEQQSYVCGVLYLLSEVLKERPDVKSLLMQPEEDDDEEHFSDVTDDEEETMAAGQSKKPTTEKKMKPGKDVEHAEKTEAPSSKAFATFSDKLVRTKSYLINARNPLYCGAQFSCAWEALTLSRHFHPSIQKFISTMLQNCHIEYNGDPLNDFTSMRFLDRFIYKNPKKKLKEHGRSLMQRHRLSSRQQEHPVNSNIFLKKGETNVREDELFFYKYFKRKHELEHSRQSKRKKAVDLKNIDVEDKDEEDEDDLEEFDFASEIKKKPAVAKKKKGKVDNSESEEDNDDDEEEMDDFDYDDIDFSDEDLIDEEKESNKQWTDKDYEKALLENLTSEEDEADEMPRLKKSKKDKTSDASLFAAADEFAHLLEDVRNYGKKSKQAEWENEKETWPRKEHYGRKMKGRQRQGRQNPKGKRDATFKRRGGKR